MADVFTGVLGERFPLTSGKLIARSGVTFPYACYISKNRKAIKEKIEILLAMSRVDAVHGACP